MKAIKLTEITHMLDASMVGKDACINSISTDTRTLRSGELFVALTGNNFDGHDYLAQARDKGAAGAIINKNVAIDLPTIRVNDTRVALGEIATYMRTEQPLPLIAITGSCGKTTTKAMLTSIMSTQGPVLSSQGSFNNDIGMPLTLLQQKQEHRYAVIEMGTNHFGEIAYLSAIARPDVAVIINIGSAHLEGFGDSKGVARAKGEIFQGLRSNGTAVINVDDTYAEYFRSLIGNRNVVTFACNNNADVRGENIQVTTEGYPSFTLRIGDATAQVRLPTVGEHNVMNALAAAASAHTVGVPIADIKTGLETMQPVAKRMIWRDGKNDVRIIDDSYNAIPDAVYAALNVLARQPGEKVFAFGGMAELGEHVEKEHTRVGEQAKALGINHLYAIGPYSHLTIKAFGNGGKYFTSKQELITALETTLHPEMTILVKGSRGSKMEEVVAALTITHEKN